MIAYSPVSIFSPALVWSLTALCVCVIGMAASLEWRVPTLRRVSGGVVLAFMVALFGVVGCIVLCGCGWWTLWCAI